MWACTVCQQNTTELFDVDRLVVSLLGVDIIGHIHRNYLEVGGTKLSLVTAALATPG